jgi:hypothetical protein
MKIDLENWSEAEIDLIYAAAQAEMLGEMLFNEGRKHQSDVAFSVERSIQAALSWIESGKVG